MMGTIVMLTQTVPETTVLTVGGAIVMAISILGVLSLSAFCMYKILGATEPSTHHHAPLDIDTRDAET